MQGVEFFPEVQGIWCSSVFTLGLHGLKAHLWLPQNNCCAVAFYPSQCLILCMYQEQGKTLSLVFKASGSDHAIKPHISFFPDEKPFVVEDTYLLCPAPVLREVGMYVFSTYSDFYFAWGKRSLCCPTVFCCYVHLILTLSLVLVGLTGSCTLGHRGQSSSRWINLYKRLFCASGAQVLEDMI